MRTLLAFTLALAPLAYATEPTTEPTPALLRHRARTLARMIELTPVLDAEVAPAFVAELEVMRDWTRVHPNDSARLEDLLRRFLASGREVHRLQADFADRDVIYAEIDEGNRIWDEMRLMMAEAPWSSLSWPEVFAGPVAAMEVRLAQRLGVDLARVYQLVEHALPTGDGFWGEHAMIREVAAGYGPATRPLYSRATLEVLYAEAARVSKALAATLRSGNVDEPDRLGIRATITRVAYGSPDFVRRDDVARYNLSLLRDGFAALDESARRTAVLEEVAHCAGELEGRR